MRITVEQKLGMIILIISVIFTVVIHVEMDKYHIRSPIVGTFVVINTM